MKAPTWAVLDPDVAAAFPNSAAVNDMLRAILELARTTKRPAKHRGGRGGK
ncbi:MAG TPA: hypothetical protein PKI11_11855 [Candidatus Hydrogenedentes bacterium]|nr:hypothetical protein [Candidatus Hydrogenedentota bacterium]HNT86409.1 hypothetical protein [Candidatus Hydrogenedentota bacterium]